MANVGKFTPCRLTPLRLADCLLAALLYVGLDEFLGIGLEHFVDLVEDVVETIGQPQTPSLRSGGRRSFCSVSVGAGAWRFSCSAIVFSVSVRAY